MRMTVGELRDLIREAGRGKSGPVRHIFRRDAIIDVTDDIINETLKESKTVYKPRVVPGGVWAPYTIGSRYSDERSYTPFDVVRAIKGLTFTNSSGVLLRVTKEQRERFAENCALEIATQFESEGYDAVLSVDSASSLSSMIGQAVSTLLSVPYLNKLSGLQKTPFTDDIQFDTDQWDVDLQRKEENAERLQLRLSSDPTNDRIKKTLHDTLGNIRDFKRFKNVVLMTVSKYKNDIRDGKKPSSTRGSDNMARRYIKGLHTIGNMDIAQYRRVLVVDDNVDRGYTFRDVSRTLESHAIEASFAAGVFIGSRHVT